MLAIFSPIVTVGSILYPPVHDPDPPSSLADMDQAVNTLLAHKEGWARLSIKARVQLIDRLIADYAAVLPRLAEAEVTYKGYQGNDFGIGQEWALPGIVLRNLQGLKRALLDIEKNGHPTIPGRVWTRPDGQVVAQVFPETVYDRILFSGYSIEVWMEPGVTQAGLLATQALAYQAESHPGKVALVLGAGNISAIGFTDALYKLFVEKQVVLLKMNPVNAYTGPIFAQGFRALIEAGFLAMTYGGAAEGAYLVHHPAIDEIHITGSDKTFDAIVFGSGAEGARRKLDCAPLVTKRITSELGNITPAIIVPGSWSESELDYQAEKLVTWLSNNTGFTCNTPHVLLVQAEWPQRQAFLDLIRKKMAGVPLSKAYYPGSQRIHQAFIAAHPEAEQIGSPAQDELPWILIPSVVEKDAHEICFVSEPFCGLLAETPIHGANPAEFLDKAVAFANQSLWGTLAAALFVQPKSMQDDQTRAAVDRAIAGLGYGTVSLNAQAGLAWYFTVAPWGGYGKQDICDAKSGIGWVHNTLMFSRAQKVVLRVPFMETPKSPARISQGRTYRKFAMALVDLEASPAWWKIPRLALTALGII
jgi:acyl-CoA reductase-like NAD-dependent aldehyde dehydrogenase